MICDGCNGHGSVGMLDKTCDDCYGTGYRCDICGDPSEPGADLCDVCSEVEGN